MDQGEVIVWWLLSLVILYLVIRLAVAAGIRDARRVRSPREVRGGERIRGANKWRSEPRDEETP